MLCDEHGLRFNPAVNSGCVLCRRGSDAEVETPLAVDRRPSALPGLLTLAALLGSMGLFGYVLMGGRLDALAMPFAQVDRAGAPPPAPATTAAPTGTSEPAPRSQKDPQLAANDDGKEESVALRVCAIQYRGGEPLVPASEYPRGGLHGAAARGDIPRLLADFDQGLPKDERDPRGRTPLMWAVLTAQDETARVLLREGASATSATYDDETPLMKAAEGGLAALIEPLLKAGASKNRVNKRGETPLMLASRRARADAIRALTANGIRLTDRCERGMTALHHAAEGSDCSAGLQQLLDLGAQVDALDGSGATPLLVAARRGHAVATDLLLQHGASIHARDYEGLGALDHVVMPRGRVSPTLRAGLLTTLDLLVGAGVELRLELDARTTPILLRDKLNAILRSAGRPALPNLVLHSDEAERPGRTPTGVRLFQALPWTDSRALPAWQRQDLLVAYKGWTRVPNVIRQVVLRDLHLERDQRLHLSSKPRGGGEWFVDDALLIEGMEGPSAYRTFFAGRAEEVRLQRGSARRVGPRRHRYHPRDLDLTSALRELSGHERIVISALDYGHSAKISELYLHITGPRAAESVARLQVEHLEAPRGGVP
ncbi:MAG: ankyrin repeat domain-containing protein [Myxococcales bacterium]|nr:ankyrin repeat domain-containing protein [Myxococcales bacterium]